MPSVRKGVCGMATDVAMGWIGARAFRGTEMHAVQLSMLVEYLVYPIYARFNAAHSVAVHGLKRAGASDFFLWRVGNTTHVPPRIHCTPTRWQHAHSAGWRFCDNQALCDGHKWVRDPPLTELRNLSMPWLPPAQRHMCAAMREASAVKADGE